MIGVNRDDPTFKRVTYMKWKQLLPAIEEEQALKCEDFFIDFVNGTKTEAECLKDVNKYLQEEGLIDKL